METLLWLLFCSLSLLDVTHLCARGLLVALCSEIFSEGVKGGLVYVGDPTWIEGV